MVNSGAMRFLQYHYIHKRLVNVCEFRIVIHKKYITAKPVPLYIKNRRTMGILQNCTCKNSSNNNKNFM